MKPEISMYFDQFIYGLGFREGSKGLDYLREAITVYRPGMMITKEVYPAVARKYKTKPEYVERVCRHAITEARKIGSREAWDEIFGYQPFKPTVQQFCATVRRYWVGNDDE